MSRLLYNLLWPFGLLLFLPGYVLKMWRRGGYGKDFGQRLGFYSRATRARLARSRPVWIHAVSVGEVAIALKLARQLQVQRPDLSVVLTTTTVTGYAFAQKSTAAWLHLLYAPLDFWPVMHTAFRRIRPDCVVLVEGEVWPNLVAEAKRAGRPIILASARLSSRSETRFRRFRRLVAPLFRQLDLICVADEREARRWYDLGAGAVEVVGNVKYDTENLPATSAGILRAEIGLDENRPVLLAGSTHRGEEAIVLDAFRELRKEFPTLFLIVAPRHVERAREIELAAQARQLPVLRRSSRSKTRSDCLLLDTTGELRAWYGVATVVFIGKSLSKRGGQNPVEAITEGKPVLFGPHMDNFASLSDDLLRQGGAVEVSSAADLVTQVRRLLRGPDLRNQMAKAAQAVIRPHLGASERTAEAIARTAGPFIADLQAPAPLR